MRGCEGGLRFVRLRVAPAVETETVSTARGGIEARLAGGRSFVVEPGFDASHLRALLAVLERVGHPSVRQFAHTGWLADDPHLAGGGSDGYALRVRSVGRAGECGDQPGPISGHLFVFASRRHERLKILTWTHGYVLWYKRLEAGVFKLPRA